MNADKANAPLILIADDEKLNRDLTRTFLENAGYRVIEATSGEQALMLAREHQPALALLDIRMVGLDGYEVTERLKRDEATRGIKVALISAQNRPADQARAREAGADDYLYKLLDWGEIMKRIAALTARR